MGRMVAVDSPRVNPFSLDTVTLHAEQRILYTFCGAVTRVTGNLVRAQGHCREELYFGNVNQQ